MNKFLSCPYCNNKELTQWQGGSLYEESCQLCHIHFSQYFKTSLQDTEIGYINFKTDNFIVYHYYDAYEPNTLTHIYHRVFPRDQNTQNPCLTLCNLPIDFTKLDLLDNKFKTLIIFS